MHPPIYCRQKYLYNLNFLLTKYSRCKICFFSFLNTTLVFDTTPSESCIQTIIIYFYKLEECHFKINYFNNILLSFVFLKYFTSQHGNLSATEECVPCIIIIIINKSICLRHISSNKTIQRRITRCMNIQITLNKK